MINFKFLTNSEELIGCALKVWTIESLPTYALWDFFIAEHIMILDRVKRAKNHAWMCICSCGLLRLSFIFLDIVHRWLSLLEKFSWVSRIVQTPGWWLENWPNTQFVVVYDLRSVDLPLGIHKIDVRLSLSFNLKVWWIYKHIKSPSPLFKHSWDPWLGVKCFLFWNNLSIMNLIDWNLTGIVWLYVKEMFPCAV